MVTAKRGVLLCLAAGWLFGGGGFAEERKIKQAEKSPVATSAEGGRNLLTNGSFELGLGAEPFYPGWVAPGNLAPLPHEVPPRPVVDETVAHSGTRSLRFTAIPGKGRAVLAFQPQVLPENAVTYFSVWVRASRPDVRFTFGVCPEPSQGPNPFAAMIDEKVGTEWTYIQHRLPKRSGYTQIRAETVSDGIAPFDLWVDDLTWTVGPHSSPARSGVVEAVLLPGSTTGIHLADKPVALTWSAVADQPREVEMRLSLCDLTRYGKPGVVWTQKNSLTTAACQGKIPLAHIRRGAYQAELEVRDIVSGAVLATGRDRFTVMTDLRNLPAPVDFACGMHYGMGFGKVMYFNWRGYWSPDEFFAMCYQSGFRVQRHIWSWEDVEPAEGKFRWEETSMDRLIEAALRNGCSSLPCIPRSPFTLKKEEYQEMSEAGFAAAGDWIYKNARDISEMSVRSAVMGYAKTQAERKMLFAPPPGSLARFCAAFAGRYRDKIVALELLNEPNLYITPQGLLDYYFKDAYPAVKQVAPNLPVLMNQTMDYAADGNGYTGQFYALGGVHYTDGFTHHPYGCDTLESGGIEAVRVIERLAKKYSTPPKPLILGMSEAHFLSNLFTRGEVVQRALLDWSIGCRWSAGAIIEECMFYEGGKRDKFFRRGPFAPGVGAMQLNAMYAVLGGSRFVRRIDHDDFVMIACFERPGVEAATRTFTVALCAAKFPTRNSFLSVNLSGVPVKAFDWCGEPMPLPAEGRIDLTADTIYLQSVDPLLLTRMDEADVTWGQRLSAVVEDPDSARKNITFDLAMLQTGLPRLKKISCDMIRDWKLISLPNGAADQSPQELGLIDAEGRLSDQMQKAARPSTGMQPYTALSVDKSGANAAHYAHSVLYVDEAGPVSFRLSANRGIKLWLNGKQVLDLSNAPWHLQGQGWTCLELPLRAGLNNLLVRGTGTPCTFALAPDGSPLVPSAKVVDEEGFIRKWAMIGPWNNIRNDAGEFIGLSRQFLPEEQRAMHGPEFLTQAVGKLIDKARIPLVWHEIVSPGPIVCHPWKDAISYAFAAFTVGQEMDCSVCFGSDDGYAIWLNGREVSRKSISRGVKIDEEKYPVTLVKGRNTVFFKIEDSGAAGGFVVRFVDKIGKPIKLQILENLPQDCPLNQNPIDARND